MTGYKRCQAEKVFYSPYFIEGRHSSLGSLVSLFSFVLCSSTPHVVHFLVER